MTPLNFREVSTTDQDIEMKFASGDHGDGSKNAFDGPGTNDSVSNQHQRVLLMCRQPSC